LSADETALIFAVSIAVQKDLQSEIGIFTNMLLFLAPACNALRSNAGKALLEEKLYPKAL
jgi:hypothetical protein